MIKIFFIQLTLALVFAASSFASPMTVVKDSNQRIQSVLKAKKQITADINEQINKIMNSVTSFEKISKRTIEKFCRKFTESECDKFDSVFQKLLRLSSVSKLGRYRADRFEYLDEKIDDKKAVVKTVAYFSDDRIDLEYHLEILDGKWMIVNYVADDIDTIRNYRRQFTRILRKESFPELIKRLERKVSTYEGSIK